MVRYVWYFFLVPGLLMLAGGAFTGYKIWQREQSMERTQGTVTGTSKTGAMGVDFQAEIRFTPHDGRSRAFTMPTNGRWAMR